MKTWHTFKKKIYCEIFRKFDQKFEEEKLTIHYILWMTKAVLHPTRLNHNQQNVFFFSVFV